MKKTGLLFVIIALVLCKYAFAWDDKRTHPNLTDAAFDGSKLHEYLKNYLNLPQGINTELVTESVKELIMRGSFCEEFRGSSGGVPGEFRGHLT